MVFVVLILKQFLACITGQFVLGQTFPSHSVWQRRSAVAMAFHLGFGRKR